MGESAIIAKVHGTGKFRRRIIEMGFVRGQKVEVLIGAPLKDPIKYKIMDYEVSLRRDEAEFIEVVSINEKENAIRIFCLKKGLRKINAVADFKPCITPETCRYKSWHDIPAKHRRRLSQLYCVVIVFHTITH